MQFLAKMAQEKKGLLEEERKAQAELKKLKPSYDAACEAVTAAEAELQGGLELGAERFGRAGGQGQHDPGHHRGEEHRREAGPKHAARQGVAVHFRQDVAEDVGEGEEEIAGAELRRSQQRQVQHHHLRGPDEVGAKQHGHEGPED